MMTLRNYALLPSVQSGYELDDQFSVVVPIARTNEIANPSGETNTTGYTAGAGTFTRTTAQQYHGAYSFIYTPSAAVNDGCYYTYTTTVALRAIHCKFLSLAAGLSYTMSIASTAPADLQSVTFTTTGRWQWISFYFQENTATTRRIYWKKNNHASVVPFYFDGVQSEVINAGETLSTYLDGDQLGFVPNQNPVAYYWQGTPHASISTRSGLTRAGGMVVNFKQFGFLLTAIVGLGLATPMNAATEYARIDGGYDDYTRKPTRQFTLSGQFQAGMDYLQLRQYRGGLARLLDRDLVGQDQRLLLRREVVDACTGKVQSTVCRVVGKYQGGLEGNTDNQISEQSAITFTQYLPNVLSDGESGAALTVQQNVSNANYIQVQNTAGLWSSVSNGTVAGASGDVNAIVIGQDGKVYIGGAFATASGVANTSRIAYYDPTDGLFHAMGTGAANNSVSYLAITSDGTLYAAGSFTSMGGIANTNSIAKWDGATWSAVGTGATTGTGILAMAVDTSNNLYVGGTFTGMGGVANTTRLARWDGSAWNALSTGANGTVRALAVGAGNVLYVGGDFGTLGGVTAAFVGSWSGTAFTGMGGGMDNSVVALAVAPNNIVYAGGDFTTAGGVTATRVAKWNGVAWQPMGAGLSTTVRVLTVMPDGTVWAGNATASGGVTFRSPMAKWNGATWVGSDNNFVSSSTVQAITPDRAGNLYVGYSSFGTANQGGLTTITNLGTARSYPTITIYGPSSGTARIFQLVNATTGRGIYLNLTLNVGEIATLVFVPDNLSFTSNFQGNIASKILPGSNTADFFLTPGPNVINMLSASTTVTSSLYYRMGYTSLDDVP